MYKNVIDYQAIKVHFCLLKLIMSLELKNLIFGLKMSDDMEICATKIHSSARNNLFPKPVNRLKMLICAIKNVCRKMICIWMLEGR
jgi:hypothetical protein